MSSEEFRPEIVTLADVLARFTGPGPVWTVTSEDLNANLISFEAGQGVAAHVNTEVDVLVVIIAGDGVIEIEGTSEVVRAGQVCLIPKGATRSLRSGPDTFAYLSIHRRRLGLWPV
jgi:quercetin dioxygenase-like cupin family protein